MWRTARALLLASLLPIVATIGSEVTPRDQALPTNSHLTQGLLWLLDQWQKTQDNATAANVSTCSPDLQRGQLGQGACNDTFCTLLHKVGKSLLPPEIGVEEPSSSDCPHVVGHLVQHLCLATSAAEDLLTEVDKGGRGDKPSELEVWGFGVLFVTLISLSSVMGVAFFPIMKKEVYKQVMRFSIGLAVGSLSATAVFHLIPQAFRLPKQDPSHNYLNIAAFTWLSAWLVFFLECSMKITVRHNRKTVDIKKAHANDLPVKNGNMSLPANQEFCYESQLMLANFDSDDKSKVKKQNGDKAILNNHHHHLSAEESGIRAVAWMVIIGDGLHNFVDGMSIGAAFSESIPTGVGMSLAIMCEEFPHELGDFAILISAGMSVRQALFFNFLSACSCYVGLVVGVLLGELEGSVFIFAFAAGLFLYISLADMIPELLNDVQESSGQGGLKSFQVFALQNAGILTGVIILYVLARFQDRIRFD